ncbi:hypothetical protein K466DRAFT_606959 [Polyporus arcularius HHB13444]|uniref:SAP domain-containing protein n=1 Tax=Polyporus arcularius HHB13444 TaxID=1314778 RepID=A0A5C3NQ20_9APHY|nr:hypothetical protein K466DRAFT_606959 [Polyporus arcularius HHB13444]
MSRRLKTFKLRIDKKLKKSDMKNYLSAFSLPKSGNREVLLTRLREYSRDPEKWASMFRANPGRKRGSISARKATKSRDAQRLLDEFGPQESEVGAYKAKKSGVEVRPEATGLSEETVRGNSAWATEVLAGLHTEAPRQAGQGSSEETRGQEAEQVPAAVGSAETPNKITGIRRIEHQVIRMDKAFSTEFALVKSELCRINAHLSEALHVAAVQAHSPTGNPSESADRIFTELPSPTTVSRGQPHRTATATPLPVQPPRSARSALSAQTNALPHIFRPPPRVLAQHEIPADKLALLDIDGDVLAFDKTSVPVPPSLSFSDVSKLFRDWYTSTDLVVNGRGIPIRHWKRLYMMVGGWKAIKAQWSRFQFLVQERELFASEDAFWAKYSHEDGRRYNYQRIVDTLQRARVRTNHHDASAALFFFHNDLTQDRALNYFKYVRSSEVIYCEKPAIVAERWRRLLIDHPDIAVQWEAVRDDFEAQYDPSSQPS